MKGHSCWALSLKLFFVTFCVQVSSSLFLWCHSQLAVGSPGFYKLNHCWWGWLHLGLTSFGPTRHRGWGDVINLVSAFLPRNAFYAVSKCTYLVQKFSQIMKATGRVIWPMGVTTAPGTIPWKGVRLERCADLESAIYQTQFRSQNSMLTFMCARIKFHT
jgi:hypothetical protein